MEENTQSVQDLSLDVVTWLLTELLAALPTALIYSLLFLLISVALIVVCQKFRIYTRDNGVWNFLTKLHYPIIVLSFMGLGFGLGFISSLKKSSDRVLDERLHPAITDMVTPLRDQVVEWLPEELADKPMTGQAIYDRIIEEAARAEAEDGEKEKGVLADLGHEIEVQARAYLIKLLVDHAVAKTGEKVGLSKENAEFSLEVFKSLDFGQQAEEIATKVTEAIKVQVAGFATGLKLQLLIYWLIIMALMVIDPLIHQFVWLPRQRKKHAGANASADTGVVDVEEVQETDPS